jgi:hypothetical protein
MRVKYFLQHKVDHNYEDLMELLELADFLLCREIQEAGASSLKTLIDETNVLGTLMFARQFCFQELESLCWKYAQYHFTRVAIEPEFLSLEVQDLKRLLQSGKFSL